MVIHGINVTLYDRTQTGTDAFNEPVYTEKPVTVENVLVAPLSETEILETTNLTGRKAVYQLGLPKGDTNEWTNRKVEFFGKTFRVIGAPQEGIEDMVPTDWHKKIRVEIVDE